MDDIKKKDKVQKLARLVRNHRGRIEHIVKREQEAVRSVSSLEGSKELQDFVDALVADLATAGQRELAGLERAIKIMERGLKQRIPAAPRQTEAERESKRLVPKRRFKGTLAWTLLPDSLDEEGAEAYRKIEKSDREFMSKTAELVNYINGRRTIHEITEALSAEYGPTNPAHVLRYLRDLCKIKLVTL
jgi:hypothetical protein